MGFVFCGFNLPTATTTYFSRAALTNDDSMATGDRRQQFLLNRRRVIAQVMVGAFSCAVGAGFIPTHRVSRSPQAPPFKTPSITPSASRSSKSIFSMNRSDGFSPTAPAAAVAFLAATVVFSSVPLDAGALAGLSSSRPSDWNRAQTLLVLSEGDDSPEVRVGSISGLVSELKGADRSEGLLSTMVKINDVVDADEEGLLENPFERESLVRGLIEKRRAGGEAWSLETETAFGVLKRKLDPFNVVLLRPYLKIAPFLGGFYYLAAFLVQQKFRTFFPVAYFGAVAVFIAPAAIILLTN